MRHGVAMEDLAEPAPAADEPHEGDSDGDIEILSDDAFQQALQSSMRPKSPPARQRRRLPQPLEPAALRRRLAAEGGELPPRVAAEASAGPKESPLPPPLNEEQEWEDVKDEVEGKHESWMGWGEWWGNEEWEHDAEEDEAAPEPLAPPPPPPWRSPPRWEGGDAGVKGSKGSHETWHWHEDHGDGKGRSWKGSGGYEQRFKEKEQGKGKGKQRKGHGSYGDDGWYYDSWGQRRPHLGDDWKHMRLGLQGQAPSEGLAGKVQRCLES